MGHGTGVETLLMLWASIFVLGVSHNMRAKRAACRRSAALFLLFCTGLSNASFMGARQQTDLGHEFSFCRQPVKIYQPMSSFILTLRQVTAA